MRAFLQLAFGLLFLTTAIAARGDELPALKVKGTKIVDDKGNTVQLRGVNLGCWLLLEPHFLGMSFRDEKSLWAGLEQRVGKAKTEEIREALRAAWINGEDFKNVKKLGLNHVRVPFPFTLLESDDAPGGYKEAGWKWLDDSVKWSEEAGIYCILDLHGAPGGQSAAEHTGEKDRNALWSNNANRQRTVKLWQAIAKRYKGRTSVAAFDLLNEPMGAPDAKTMLALQTQLLHAIRDIDSQRLVIIEDGYKGIERFTVPAVKDKPGVIYSVHVYPTLTEAQPTPQHHERYFSERLPKMLREQARFGQPVYIGEWNVVQESDGGAPMIKRHVEAMNRAGWSWALWIYKQTNPDGVRGLWSLYRNTKKLDLPNFERDDAETILKKIRTQMGHEHFELYGPVAKALAEE
jgi:aryl-phospho-beta-D-glucosidase BglC (GH1 family)